MAPTPIGTNIGDKAVRECRTIPATRRTPPICTADRTFADSLAMPATVTQTVEQDVRKSMNANA